MLSVNDYKRNETFDIGYGVKGLLLSINEIAVKKNILIVCVRNNPEWLNLLSKLPNKTSVIIHDPCEIK